MEETVDKASEIQSLLNARIKKLVDDAQGELPDGIILMLSTYEPSGTALGMSVDLGKVTTEQLDEYLKKQ